MISMKLLNSGHKMHVKNSSVLLRADGRPFFLCNENSESASSQVDR